MLPDPTSVRYADLDGLPDFKGVLIDVRLAEAYGERRIAGSRNACVYEIAFAKQVEDELAGKGDAIVLYGAGGKCHADLAAYERLRSAGFTDVQVLRGGLAAWELANLPTEGSGLPERDLAFGRFALDTERSRVRWIGRNLTNQHDGEVRAVAGSMEIGAEGFIVGGEVTVDLRQMTCRDLADSSLAGVLIGHLQNADFFEVARYPEARFTLSSAKPLTDRTPGKPNYRVEGILKARGKEASIVAEALVEAIDGGNVFQSTFAFDRTELGAVYGSGRFFERLGMHLVNDLVTIDVSAVFVGDGQIL